MFKVVKSRKANKIAYLLVLVTMLTSLAATPMKAYAVEVGDVLYEETEDNYVQEDITDEDDYYYPSDNTGSTGTTEGTTGSTDSTESKTEDKKENTGSTTGSTGTTEGTTGSTGTTEGTTGNKDDSVADSLGDLDDDQFIDADTPIGDDSTVGDELDKSDTEGNEIPEDVEDEVEKKDLEDPTEPTEPEPTDPEPTDPEPTNPEPTDPEPTDPEPTEPEPEQPDVPKMGDDYTRYYVGGAVGAAIIGLLASIKNQLNKHKEAMAVLGSNEKSGKVVKSRKKYAKKGKKKLL